MTENQNSDQTGRVLSFYERPNAKKEIVPVAGGIPLGIESVTNSRLGIAGAYGGWGDNYDNTTLPDFVGMRSEEHTSELQSQFHIVCRLLLEKKKKIA